MTAKRMMAGLLILCMTIGWLPAPVHAETNVSMEQTSLSVNGTNSFGQLLSQELEENGSLTAAPEDGSCGITGLEFEDNVAYVTYDSAVDAVLIVAVYSEDGLQLLTSATLQVSPEDHEAAVAMEGQLPQYFYAGAFLASPEDLSPLCQEYTTPMYTRQMQELLDSTVADYDPDRVYNLDEDETTNFAVFADEVLVLVPQAGANTVVSADDENRIYVIENADQTVTGLTQGQILAYPYGGENMLIVKVASVTVQGTTVTITGADVELEEVFAYVKIEGTGDPSQTMVDTAGADEGVTYEGLVQEDTPAARSLGGDVNVKWSHLYGIDKEWKPEDVGGAVQREGELQAGVRLTLELDLKYYFATGKQYVDFNLDVNVKLDVKIKGKLDLLGIKLCNLGVKLVPGVYAMMQPTVVISFEGEAAANVAFGFTLGFKLEDGWGRGIKFTNGCKPPRPTAELKFEGSIFFGVDMCPELSILSDKVATAKMSDVVGLEIKGTNVIKADGLLPDETEVHECVSCLDGDISAKLNVKIEIKLLNQENLKLERELIDLEHKLWDFYYSWDHDTGGLTECPYRKYRISVEVKDSLGNRLADTEVQIFDQNDEETDEKADEKEETNENGVAVFYLPSGEYTAKLTIEDQPISAKFYVYNKSRKVSLYPGVEDEVFIGLDPEDYMDACSIEAFGSCGSNVYWELYGDGLLRIYGEGNMKNMGSWVQFCGGVPWSDIRNLILKIQVEEGVLSIGESAFENCDNLVSVVLPEGLQAIDDSAFYGCNDLTQINFPSTLTSIGAYAFEQCKSLEEITIPCNISKYAFQYCKGLKKVTILGTVSSIGEGAFYCCTKLNDLEIQEGVTKIKGSAFYGCDDLPEAVIPNTVKTIGKSAFGSCDELVAVKLPGGLEEIAESTFSGCVKLSDIQLPQTLIYIDDYAFNQCKSLKEVTIPCSVGKHAFEYCKALEKVTIQGTANSVGSYAFRSCEKLTEVVLEEGITKIGSNAFGYCAFSSITIPNSVTYIGKNAFESCYDLYQVILPENLTEIEEATFSGCGALTELWIPTSVTKVGAYAFSGCKSLTEMEIFFSVGRQAFEYCKGLHTVHFYEGTKLGSSAFYSCTVLKNMYFYGDPPSISGSAFTNVKATAYYPVDNENWTADHMKNYDGTLTWVGYTVAEDGSVTLDPETVKEPAQPLMTASLEPIAPTTDTIAPQAVHGGEYTEEVLDKKILRTASFADLAPGGEYLLVVVKSMSVEDLLAAENLLYVSQGAAAADGTLVFQYVQREETDISYVLLCGAATKNMKDAQITFPEMAAEGGLQAVAPTVTYDGVVLTEGVDYEITGEVDFDTAGQYTCYIRGIGDYTGTVECVYTVKERLGLLGDINGDEEVNIFDANLAASYYNEVVELTADQLLAGDVNGDGEVDIFDANLIAAYFNEVIDKFPAEN